MDKHTEHNSKSDFLPQEPTKADRRQIRKRPRMKVHGSSLRKPTKFAGLSIVKKTK